MRKVQVFKWEQQVIDGCRTGVKVADFIGTFHQFGQEADGEGQSNPVAIVERQDGQLETPYCGLVQFLPSRYQVPTPPPQHIAAQERLLTELVKADRIINVMLNAMTTAQKSQCAAQLAADGVSQDGMARAHERAAVLKDAGAA